MFMKINKPKGKILSIYKNEIFYEKNNKTYILDVFTQKNQEIKNFRYLGEIFSYELNKNVMYRLCSIDNELIEKATKDISFLENYMDDIFYIRNSSTCKIPLSMSINSCYFKGKLHIYIPNGIISMNSHDKSIDSKKCDYRILQPFIIYKDRVFNQITNEFSDLGFVSSIFVNHNLDLFIEYKTDNLHLLNKNCKTIASSLLFYMKKNKLNKCLLVIFKILFYY